MTHSKHSPESRIFSPRYESNQILSPTACQPLHLILPSVGQWKRTDLTFAGESSQVGPGLVESRKCRMRRCKTTIFTPQISSKSIVSKSIGVSTHISQKSSVPDHGATTRTAPILSLRQAKLSSESVALARLISDHQSLRTTKSYHLMTNRSRMVRSILTSPGDINRVMIFPSLSSRQLNENRRCPSLNSCVLSIWERKCSEST